MKKGTRSTRTAYLTGHTSRNEPNVGVRDAIKIACDPEDTVTLMPSASGAGGHNVAATTWDSRESRPWSPPRVLRLRRSICD